MGLYSNIYSKSEEICAVERIVVGIYDEATARSNVPGFDDVTGEPFLEDSDDDGIGERDRPETIVTILGKVKETSGDEQQQDQTGNAPSRFIRITVATSELIDKGLLEDGVCGIGHNDRLVRIENKAGAVRVDYAHNGRQGLNLVEVKPGETGTGIWQFFFEKRRPAAR